MEDKAESISTRSIQFDEMSPEEQEELRRVESKMTQKRAINKAFTDLSKTEDEKETGNSYKITWNASNFWGEVPDDGFSRLELVMDLLNGNYDVVLMDINGNVIPVLDEKTGDTFDERMNDIATISIIQKY